MHNVLATICIFSSSYLGGLCAIFLLTACLCHTTLAEESPPWKSHIDQLNRYTQSIKTLRLIADVEIVSFIHGKEEIHEESREQHCIELNFQNKNGKVQTQIFLPDAVDRTNPKISETLLIDSVFYRLTYDQTEDCLLIFCPTLLLENQVTEEHFLASLFKNTAPPVWAGIVVARDGRRTNITDFFDLSENVSTVDDGDKVRIISSTNDSRMEVVINQSMNGIPIEILCKNEPTSQHNFLSKFKYVADEIVVQNNIAFPKSYILEMESQFQQLVFSEEEKKPVPTRLHTRSRCRVVFSQISVNDIIPTKNFSFTTEVPNYTKVIVEDVPQIKYVWLDGKVVPYTDELALARVRGHGFKPGVREPRFWMMGAGILMIVIALVLKVREYLAKRKGG